MRYLIFDITEGTDGVFTLEAMAATTDRHAHEEAKAEAEQVIAWAHQNFPDRTGPVEDGHAWDHEQLIQHEDGGWITLTLSLSASTEFVDMFKAVFCDAEQ
ncbi:MAG: hypothetical protein EOP39_09030 [Rubrivivax sp.]|nr:MAG: hypothetical protein EOP39_09030 [Rubrivivax sp.]